MKPEIVQETQFAVCLKNIGYAASLERRKVYVILPDTTTTRHGYVRVIDESGEDYLYPQDYFVTVALPQLAQEVLLAAS